MTPADRDTLLTIVQQWRERRRKACAEYEEQNNHERRIYLLGKVDVLERCADDLTALLARLAPLETTNDEEDLSRVDGERLPERTGSTASDGQGVQSSPAPEHHTDGCSCNQCRRHTFMADSRGDCRYCGDGPDGPEHV
jgi:hypothetical protein